jgi:DNA ligase-1
MTSTTVIYKRDSNGGLRTWQAEIAGAEWRTTAGGPGRKPVTSGWTRCTGKQGRTDEQQAEFEAFAAHTQKLAREYRQTEAELNDVPKSPMLAKSYEPGAVKFPVFCQPKLDGIRALISKDGAFTREYQRHLNVEHILKALSPVFVADDAVVLDGELYNHDFKDDFGRISSIVRKQNPTPEQLAESEKYLQFHCYDQFNHRHPNASFGERWSDLQQCIFPVIKSRAIVDVATHEVTGAEELDMMYGVFLEQGYEGQMVRLDAPYEFDKRSKNLLKRKEFITAEFKLLRIEEGNGNWAGYAKRVVFELPDGRECGAGIRGTQEQMKLLLITGAMELARLGRTPQVTIRHFTPTPDGMPRFPVAVDFHFGGRKD